MKETRHREFTLRTTETLFKKIRESAYKKAFSINQWINNVLEDEFIDKPVVDNRPIIKMPEKESLQKLYDTFYLSMQLIKEQSDLIEKQNYSIKCLELERAHYRRTLKELNK